MPLFSSKNSHTTTWWMSLILYYMSAVIFFTADPISVHNNTNIHSNLCTLFYVAAKYFLFAVKMLLLAWGLRKVRPVVQIPNLFSAWLDYNFLGFGEQDMLPCTQENRSDVLLVPVCEQEIKHTHTHRSTKYQHCHHLLLFEQTSSSHKSFHSRNKHHSSFKPQSHTPLHVTGSTSGL